MMIAYASRTGTRRNLDALRRAGWRLMVSARGVLRTEGFRYALDNGAWTSFQRGEPFDEAAFERAVARLGADADWIVVPDIVMGGMASLKFSRTWLARLRNRRSLANARFMVAVQNGIMPAHVRDLVGPRVGVFVGGDTEWKLATMAGWARFARARGVSGFARRPAPTASTDRAFRGLPRRCRRSISRDGRPTSKAGCRETKSQASLSVPLCQCEVEDALIALEVSALRGRLIETLAFLDKLFPNASSVAPDGS